MGRRAEKISPLEIAQLEISQLEISTLEIAQVEISQLSKLAAELAAELARGARSGEVEIEIAEEVARRPEEIGPVGPSVLGGGAEAAAHLGGVISREHERAAGRRRRIWARSAAVC